jgi:hypothetical protein
VIFTDGSWGIHSALEVDEMIDDPDDIVHQAIPVNAILREFIAYETTSR